MALQVIRGGCRSLLVRAISPVKAPGAIATQLAIPRRESASPHSSDFEDGNNNSSMAKDLLWLSIRNNYTDDYPRVPGGNSALPTTLLQQVEPLLADDTPKEDDIKQHTLKIREEVRGNASENPQKRLSRQLAMVHNSLRSDFPDFFCRRLPVDIYAHNVLFEETVSWIGLSCHGLASYRRLLHGLRSLAKIALSNPCMEVLSCTKDERLLEVHIRWRVVGRWRFLARPYRLDAMSIYVMGRDGCINYHRCDRIQRDQTRAGIFDFFRPTSALDTALPTCSGITRSSKQ